MSERNDISKKITGLKRDNYRLPEPIYMATLVALIASLMSVTFDSLTPGFLFSLKEFLGPKSIYSLWKFTLIVHSVEALYAFRLCFLRGGYSGACSAKWIISVFIFGIFSLKDLIKLK
ncbi:hypothetical protein DSO57_1015535 [Entomophthora muscae]|uniref:Uncharacterized protein n=1 Tax=Entomophthora muscae TaxID=34485 RepID=A0ACC2RJU4_9FUNG|nr:hypothetical protein DSO57_1015535 [Entomophthora muscae]